MTTVVSVQMRLLLATLCVSNAVVLMVLGAMSAFFVAGVGRLVIAVAFWVAAAGLLVLARSLRRPVEWR